ncbi:MAG: hypothetical protein ACK55I_07625, partial [bacterium]
MSAFKAKHRAHETRETPTDPPSITFGGDQRIADPREARDPVLVELPPATDQRVLFGTRRHAGRRHRPLVAYGERERLCRRHVSRSCGRHLAERFRRQVGYFDELFG